MAKQVTQGTFDDVVKENIQEFEMTIGAAITDAVQQFESQVGFVITRAVTQIVCASQSNARDITNV